MRIICYVHDFNMSDELDLIWNAGILVKFNDLPKHSIWSKRMLGLLNWSRIERSDKELEREFENEIYFPLYQQLLSDENIKDIDSLSSKLYKLNDVCCSRKGNFRVFSFTEARRLWGLWILHYLSKFADLDNTSAIVDIGAGAGQVILKIALSNVFNNTSFYALERMHSAREIIKILSHRNNCNINIDYCDFMSKNIANCIPENAILYTSYVLQVMTHHPKDIIDNFCDLKPAMVFNFEPFISFYDQNTIYGELCAKYLGINKYNTTFDSVLHNSNGKTIDIIYEEGNIFGTTPYLPGSLIVWKPK